VTPPVAELPLERAAPLPVRAPAEPSELRRIRSRGRLRGRLALLGPAFLFDTFFG
jgi:hypothetical protein